MEIEPTIAPVLSSVKEELSVLVDKASANSYQADRVPKLLTLVMGDTDVWRTSVGANQLACVDPLRIQLVPDAQSFCCRLRHYPYR